VHVTLGGVHIDGDLDVGEVGVAELEPAIPDRPLAVGHQAGAGVLTAETHPGNGITGVQELLGRHLSGQPAKITPVAEALPLRSSRRHHLTQWVAARVPPHDGMHRWQPEYLRVAVPADRPQEVMVDQRREAVVLVSGGRVVRQAQHGEVSHEVLPGAAPGRRHLGAALQTGALAEWGIGTVRMPCQIGVPGIGLRGGLAGWLRRL